MVSKIVNGILGTKSTVARNNEALAAAQQALLTGQQVHIKNAATNRLYKQLVAQHGGKSLGVAHTSDGTVVAVPGAHGSVHHLTIVNGVVVSNIETG